MTPHDIEGYIREHRSYQSNRDIAAALGVTPGRVHAAAHRIDMATMREDALGHAMERRHRPLWSDEVRCPHCWARPGVACIPGEGFHQIRLELAQATPRGPHVLDGGLSERIAWALYRGGLHWRGSITTVTDGNLVDMAHLGVRQIKRVRAWK